MVKNLPAKQEAKCVLSLCPWEPLEKEMETHSSILAWEIPWTEEHGWLHFMGSQRVRHDLAIPVSPRWASFFLSANNWLSLFSPKVGRYEKHFLAIPLREPNIMFTKHTCIWRSKVVSKVTCQLKLLQQSKLKIGFYGYHLLSLFCATCSWNNRLQIGRASCRERV